MKCLRHKIHLNLFVSVLSANLAWLLVYVITVGDHLNMSRYMSSQQTLSPLNAYI